MQNIENSRIPKQQDRMRLLQERGCCLFCPQGMELLEKKKLFETKGWFVTENDFPYEGAINHLLAVPKRHISLPDLLTENEVSELFGTVIPTLQTKFGNIGFTCLFRFGNTKQTGATIEHLHVHFISGAERASKDHPTISAVVGFQKQPTT